MPANPAPSNRPQQGEPVPPRRLDLADVPDIILGGTTKPRRVELAEAIDLIPVPTEPTAHQYAARVLVDYVVRGLVLEQAEELWAAAYIRARHAVAPPPGLRQWTANQAGYDHDRTLQSPTRSLGLSIPREVVPTRHGPVAHTMYDGIMAEVALLRTGHTSSTYLGTVHRVVGGWVSYTPDGQRASVLRSAYHDAEATLLPMRTGGTQRGVYPRLQQATSPAAARAPLPPGAAPAVPPPPPVPGANPSPPGRLVLWRQPEPSASNGVS